jgi:peptidase A4-like protein/immunoglobulin I-set domain protein
MSKLHRIATCAVLIGGFLSIAVGTTALAVSAGASTSHVAARLIDTDRVVGTPQLSPGLINAAGSPVVTTNPTSVTVAAGAKATFTAAATGTPTPTVKWAYSLNGGAFKVIAGATSTTLTLTASTSENGAAIEAEFTNSAGSAKTTAATLTVTSSTPPAAPVVTTNPSSITVASGGTASFTAAATGSPTPTVLWQVSTDGGATYNSISGATSTTYSFTAATSENGYEYEAVFTNASGSATTSPATLTVSASTAPQQSSNWSGYADPSPNYNNVAASWTVAAVTCTSKAASYSSAWIGIDGYTTSTVEQDGTEADCLSKTPSYDAWYEMFGDSAVNGGDEVELSPTTNPVVPGDVMTASVNLVGTSWTLAISDASTAHTGWSFTKTITFTGGKSTGAEWIVERPEVCSSTCALTALADYGSITFTGASATTSTGSAGSISSQADVELEMVNNSTVLALPTALTDGGSSFTDNWQAAG